MSDTPTLRHLQVRRTARLALVGSPGATVRELWVACHGYGQLAPAFAQALAPLRAESRVVAVPEALSRFYLDDPAKRHGPDSPIGASWMTREDREREISDYVAYLDQVAATVTAEIGHGSIRTIALGFSQGAATACRWAALGTTPIARLVVWGGTLPKDLPAAPDALFRGASVTLVGGRKDRLATPEALEEDRRALTDRGIDATLVWHDGGHALSSATLREIAGAQ